MPELSFMLIVRRLLVGWTFMSPPESGKSKVSEDPGCHNVERMTSSNDRKLCFAVETFRFSPCALILPIESAYVTAIMPRVETNNIKNVTGNAKATLDRTSFLNDLRLKAIAN
jgi:hypothetical protein